jgi:predicted CXXCH cytochrome family protein
MSLFQPVAFIILLAGLFLPFQSLNAAGNLTQNSSRECAICHFRWIDQFVQGQHTVLADYETEDVAGVELMCFSCHDGSTADSRSEIWLHDMHKTGIKPSDNVKIPKLFPLSKDGQMVCATCHSAHSNPTDTSIERSVFLRITNNDSIMCELCHINQVPPENNHPIHSGKKPLPEQLFSEGASLSFTDTNHVICESCHTAHASVERTLVHTMADSALCIICHTDKVDANPTQSATGVNHPLKVEFKTDPSLDISLQAGAKNSLLCLSCHKVHEHAPGTKALVVPRDPLCSFCHADKDDRLSPLKGLNSNHPLAVTFKPSPDAGTQLDAGENNSVRCFTCHRIHQHTPETKALAAERDPLCSSCHAAQYNVERTDHDLAVTASAELNSEGQGSKQYGVCVSCHVPHKASGPFLWSRSGLKDMASPSALCLSCHSKEGPGAKKSVGNYSHPVGVKVKDSQQLPLHTQGNGETVMECHTCHDPHQWQPGHNNKGEGENIEGDGESSFLRQPCAADQVLCSTCHPEESRVEQTDHDLRITGPQLNNIAGNNANQTGSCSSCHIPHNGSGPMLWAQPLYGKGESTSRLCLSCHNRRGAASKKTVGKYSHPVGVAVDASLDLPLHKINETTSVMECATCHNPHIWRPDRQQHGNKENVEGDGLSSFLRETSVGDPVLCNKCHPRQSNVAGTEHDMRVVAPDTLKSEETTSSPTSICTPCHTVHNATNQAALWNAALSPYRKDFMARACYGCHNSEGVGKEKPVKVGSHPQRIHFGYNKPYASTKGTDQDLSVNFPLYDKHGQKKMSGEITCPTCHDPHIWQLGKVEKGPGVNLEGTPVNSFLRKDVRRGFCYQCHGIKTLSLYRYYHVVEERKKLMGPYSPLLKQLAPRGTGRQKQSRGNTP